jgi:hypothetical protein
MTPTVPAAGAAARPPLESAHADTLRALAEATVRGPAARSLVARLNPGHPRQLTLCVLAQLREAGLVVERPHPLTRLPATYALSPAGRRWVRHHG